MKTIPINVEIPDNMSEQDALELIQEITNITSCLIVAGLEASGYDIPDKSNQ